MLHDGHWGIVEMKQLARQYIWWINIDDDITKVVSDCEISKIQNQVLAKEYESWPKSTKPWERVYVDFAGHLFNDMWLICVNSFSQFSYVSSMRNISALSAIFSTEVIPNTIVIDNGPQRSSEKFKQLCIKAYQII